MLFITNRFPKGSLLSKANRKFEFDLRNNAPSNSVFFCQRHADGHITEVMGANFLLQLKQSPYRQLLLYIHGFSNLPDDVFQSASELQQLCNAEKPEEVLVVPVIWPCDNDLGIVKDYWDDQKSADQSAAAFSRALSIFMDWRSSPANEPETAPCLKRINVLAHSMGNRVLRQTLVDWDKNDLADGVPLIFRNTFMVAADIRNESIHKNQPGKLIADASRNVVVYFASDDLALRSSKVANLKNKVASRRLGHTGPEDISQTPHNLYSVDCDDLNNSYDNPKGHSYFGYGRQKGQAGLVFKHIFECMLHGRVFPQDEFRRSSVLREN